MERGNALHVRLVDILLSVIYHNDFLTKIANMGQLTDITVSIFMPS